MSHEITETDGLVLTGEPAWHGLGVVVKDAPSPAEALKIAGLTWDVEQVPLFGKRKTVTLGTDDVPVETESEMPVTSHVANVRADTGAVLGVVGADYSVVQNRELAGLILDAANAENVEMETMGSLRGGKNVFALARLSSFNIGERDKSYVYALFANAHDGTAALRILPTSVRVVCMNTYRMATESGAQKLTVSLRHTSGLADRLEDVRASLRGAASLAAHEEEKARALAARRMTTDEIAAFFGKAYQTMYGEMPVETPDMTRGERTRLTKAREMASEWAGRLALETRYLDSPPTAWLAANAVTRWIDHERTTRGGERTYSNLLGTGADAKASIFAEALALIK